MPKPWIVGAIATTAIVVSAQPARASDELAVAQYWLTAHYQLSLDFGSNGPRTQSTVSEAGGMVPFIGLEASLRAGTAWNSDAGASWQAAQLGVSLGWRAFLIPELGFVPHQSLLVPSIGVMADAFILGNGTTIGRGAAYLQNTSWFNCWFGVQVRGEVGFVSQPFPFAIGVGLVFGARYYIDDGMYRCR